MSRDWDAATYDRVSNPQVEWAKPVLERLALSGDETVLDAGCGSGRVTKLLLERVPKGRVIAVDSAPAMVAKAREALGDRAEIQLQDLAELRLDEPVDAVFSNAVFHWVLNHERLFGRLFDVLRPGGRLEAQCGGAGNIQTFHDAVSRLADRPPFSSYFEGWSGPWNFATAEETAGRLERAGFAEVRCWLEEWPVEPPEPHDYLRTVCLGHHLEQLPDELRDTLVGSVVESLGDPLTLEYVRLNISARRPG
ncbi:MAG: trans-aconitate 2-methyltransferase [Thermoleophilaceae bacterium]|nr:trans-aconitate 2-methyltransferase [Thermoleophilaceae bacterium]